MTGQHQAQFGIQSDLRLHLGLGRIAAFGLVALFLGVTACVQPVQGESRTVVLEGREAGNQLALFVEFVFDLGIFGEVAVDTLGDLLPDCTFRARRAWSRLRAARPPSFLYISMTLVHQRHEHVAEHPGFSRRIDGSVVPEQPAAAVGDRTVFFQAVCRRQQEALGLDLFGINTRTMPVVRGFRMVQLGSDQPFEIVQGLADLVGVRHGLHGVQADDKAATNLVVVHFVEQRQVGVVAALFDPRAGNRTRIRFPVYGVFAVPGLEQADEVLGLVLPPVGAHGIIADRRIGLEVLVEVVPFVVRAWPCSRARYGKAAYGRWNPVRWARRAGR